MTAIVLFPFLLYIVFFDEDLVPRSITLHELPDEYRQKPVNPNIPHAHPDGAAAEGDEAAAEREKMLSLEEIMV